MEIAGTSWRGWAVAARAKRGGGAWEERREERGLEFVGVRVGFKKNEGLLCKLSTKLLAPCSVLGRALGDVASRGGPREP